MPTPPLPRPGRRAGQAAIEFTVGLVALLAAAVAILTVGVLSRADTDAMAEAQAKAAEASMGNGIAESPPPLSDVDAGPDGRALTADDAPVAGSLGPVRTRIAGVALRDGAAAAWDGTAGYVPRHDALPELAGGSSAASVNGLRTGSASRTVELPPAAEPLFGLGAEAETERTVLLPQTGGLH